MHRDLKPDNILLDSDDRAVIADFGLSRFCHPTNDHTAETGTYRCVQQHMQEDRRTFVR